MCWVLFPFYWLPILDASERRLFHFLRLSDHCRGSHLCVVASVPVSSSLFPPFFWRSLPDVCLIMEAIFAATSLSSPSFPSECAPDCLFMRPASVLLFHVFFCLPCSDRGVTLFLTLHKGFNVMFLLVPRFFLPSVRHYFSFPSTVGVVVPDFCYYERLAHLPVHFSFPGVV